MKKEENRKLNAFKRFGVLVMPSAVVSFISFIQLVDPSVFGENHPVICWVGGFAFLAMALYQLNIVRKGSNTGSQA